MNVLTLLSSSCNLTKGKTKASLGHRDSIKKTEIEAQLQ